MKNQMELTLTNATPACRRAPRRQRRLPSAGWWFEQMRKAVDEAIEWPTTPPARAEQTHLLLAAGPQPTA
jgi:hypothetical protein